MRIFFFLLFLPNILFSQETKLRVLSEENGPDNTIVTIAELIVQNKSLDPICILISTWFVEKNMSKDTVELATFGNDTVELATFGNDNYASYDLLFTKKDVDFIIETNRQYPLILYGLTSFVATVKLVRKSTCKDQLFEVSYLKIPKYKYEVLLDMFWHDQRWDPDIKLKFQTKSVHF
jgi:hypothetical protein